MSERVNWKYLLEEEVDDSLQHHVDNLDNTEAGRLVHNWLQDTFEDELPLEWENYIENGKYDAFDGTCIYEFKTKHPAVFHSRPPYDGDIEQIDRYLDSRDINADFGIIVYINRGDLTEIQEYFYDGYETTQLS